MSVNLFMRKGMVVYVKVLTGTVCVTLQPTDTVLHLKEMLVDHTGERVEEMWLRFNGQTVQDDSTLTNCGIEEGAVIEVSLRLTSSPWWIPTLKNLENYEEDPI
ncbi:hypothetical protein BGZ98_001081 [Dissophora globulifera]|nr:hypothetical protein BGZ98_001081 [Dissophora globulifera]